MNNLEILNNLVNEKGITKIILDYKKQMEYLDIKEKYKNNYEMLFINYVTDRDIFITEKIILEYVEKINFNKICNNYENYEEVGMNITKKNCLVYKKLFNEKNNYNYYFKVRLCNNKKINNNGIKLFDFNINNIDPEEINISKLKMFKYKLNFESFKDLLEYELNELFFNYNETTKVIKNRNNKKEIQFLNILINTNFFYNENINHMNYYYDNGLMLFNEVFIKNKLINLENNKYYKYLNKDKINYIRKINNFIKKYGEDFIFNNKYNIE